jgi:hypothetical protein
VAAAESHERVRVAVHHLGEPEVASDLAARIVAAVADLPDPGTRRGWASAGWRTMAGALDLPPWQARRLCVALLGTATWPGLFARMLREGAAAWRSPAMRQALRCTRVRRLRSPVLTAIRADDHYAVSYPQLAAG